MSELSFSVFTKLWSDWPLEVLAERVKAWGFDGIEFPLRKGSQLAPEHAEKGLPALVRQFADCGLRVFSVASDLDEPIFAACAAAGVPQIRIMAKVDEDYLASEQRIKRLLESKVALCETYGVKIGVQQHHGYNVSDCTGLLRIVESFDPKHIGAIWDAAHDALAGQQPEIGLNVIWSHLSMANFKNVFYVRTNGPEASEAQWTKHFTTGRHGIASWPRAVRHLRKRQYGGVVCLTAQYEDKANSAKYIREDLDYVRSLFAGDADE